jgi:hypothetical protein
MISPAKSLLPAVLLLLVFADASRSAPLPIDGHLDAAYGPALATQQVGTPSNDTVGVFDTSNGWELDEAYGVIRDGVLDLLLTGNLELEPLPTEPSTISSGFNLFFDTAPGGRDTVAATVPPGLLNVLSGLRFDSDFAADAWIGGYGNGGPDFGTPYALQFYSARLSAAAQDTMTYLGQVQPVGAGTLTGGSNPFGIQAALDNSNLAGVGQSCGASSGAGASTGFELSIPLAALGNPTGPIKVCVFLMTDFNSRVSNQVLGPVPAGSCSLGDPHKVDFSAVPGAQYFVVAPTAGVPVPSPRGPLLVALSRVPGLVVRFRAPGSEPAAIEVHDPAGRLLITRAIAGEAAGTVTLADRGTLPAGLYFLRLRQGGNTARAKAIVLP